VWRGGVFAATAASPDDGTAPPATGVVRGRAATTTAAPGGGGDDVRGGGGSKDAVFFGGGGRGFGDRARRRRPRRQPRGGDDPRGGGGRTDRPRTARRRAACPAPVWRGGVFSAAAAAPADAAAPKATGVVRGRAAATTAAPGGDLVCGGGLSLYVICFLLSFSFVVYKLCKGSGLCPVPLPYIQVVAAHGYSIKAAAQVSGDMLEHRVDGQDWRSIELVRAGPATQPAASRGKYIFNRIEVGSILREKQHKHPSCPHGRQGSLVMDTVFFQDEDTPPWMLIPHHPLLHTRLLHEGEFGANADRISFQGPRVLRQKL